ncbi:FAD-dependent monooxygenase [Sphingomonas naphthae]|uniref:FAD-dependent monooxygenase n=1 Tax=Sphingomonas naphthae TaxID=1813468 RepID=A0ABY7TKL6_9SPHN|nr:FAD-dependent monooxygenase [Sphingomonas naphthae]WCT73257.1 FAD-dependent monooxygenase [Sphingomonas naphthae]
MRRTPPLIAGGGPAGTAAAITLAMGGQTSLVIERSNGPHDLVCGAFLGWDALARLERLGIDVAALGATRIDRVRLIAGGRIAEARLPHPAAGLSRARLDEALRAHAVTLGVEVRRGTAIRRIEGRTLHLAEGDPIESDSLFLATGKHDLRGQTRPHAPHPSVGLRRALHGGAGLEGVIELHLLRGGYAGLLLQEDGRANLCLSIDPARLATAGGIDGLVAALAGEAPQLAARLAGGGGPWVSIAGVPYGWRGADTRPGLFRLGDQAAVIASLAGDGIAIALASGESAAQAWQSGGAGAAPGWQRAFAARARRPIALAEGLRHLAERPAIAAPLVRLIAAAPALAGLFARATRIG